MMRLNRFLAQAGLGSRRAVERLILEGAITIDGRVVRELATRVDAALAEVAVQGRPVRPARRLAYLMMHKPRGYDVTRGGRHHHRRAHDLLPAGTHLSVQSVGRLDRNSTGLLLFTNDGQLAFRLAHPRFGCQKVYLVRVAGEVSAVALRRLVEGVTLEDGPARARVAKREPGAEKGFTTLRIVIAEGRNRIVRRMCESIGHPAIELHRDQVGPLKLGDLRCGRTRPLKSDEVRRLRESVDLPPDTHAAVPPPHADSPGKRISSRTHGQ